MIGSAKTFWWLEPSVLGAYVRKSLGGLDGDSDEDEGHRAYIGSDTVARVGR